jgi:hypothetical protein
MFPSVSSLRQFFVADRRSHERNTNHLRLDDFAVRFRFEGTGQGAAGTEDRPRNLKFSKISIFERLRKK